MENGKNMFGKSEMDEVIKELTERYSCDAFYDIEARKVGKTKWVLKFCTWDGYIFELTVTDARVYKGECKDLEKKRKLVARVLGIVRHAGVQPSSPQER